MTLISRTASAPKITLRSVKVHAGLSQETPAYTATIYVDGKKFSDVSNSGHGGPDMHSATPAKVKELNDIIAETFPGITFHDITIPNDLQVICHTLAWESVERRNLSSRLSRNVLFIDPKTGALMQVKGKATAEYAATLATHYGVPSVQVLNLMDTDAAFAMFKEKSKRV
jgi:hypothetical protein